MATPSSVLETNAATSAAPNSKALTEPSSDTELRSILPKVHLELVELWFLRYLFQKHVSANGVVDLSHGFPDLIQALLDQKLDPPEETFLCRWFHTCHDGHLNVKEFVMRFVKLEKSLKQDAIAHELKDMGFAETKPWEEDYNVFTATSSPVSLPSASNDTLLPILGAGILNLNGIMLPYAGISQSPAGGSPMMQYSDPEILIDFETLCFDKEIGRGSFAEVWEARWQQKSYAVKVFAFDKIKPTKTQDSIPMPKDDDDFGESLLGMETESQSLSTSAEQQPMEMGSDQLECYVKGANMIPRAGVVLSFMTEVQMLQKLRHENIQLLIKVCFDPPHPLCIVSELVAGGSMFNYLHKCLEAPPIIGQSMKLAKDIACGMLYLHSHNPPIFHRDLKAANVLIEHFNPNVNQNDAFGKNDLKAVIIDFGLSLVEGSPAEPLALPPSGMIGSLVTMAPEVMSGEPYTSAGDVYSYGIVLWELFTGRIPFKGLTPPQLIYGVCDTNLRPAFLPEDNIPTGIRRLIQLCWDRDPKKRPDFSSIVAMWKGENVPGN